MNIEDLVVFKEVAKKQNITKAAEYLNFGQSNVTAKIKRLEEYYDTELFYRHRQGVTLTSYGKLLLSYTDKILLMVDDAEKAIKYDNYPNGHLTLGSIETTIATKLPVLLSNFHKGFPEVELSLHTGTTEELIKLTIEREIDGAFVSGDVKNPKLSEIEVFEEELVLLAKESVLDSMDFEQIESQTIIVFKSGCFYRETFEYWLKINGINTPKILELNTLDGVLGCIKAGLGISLLTKSAAENIKKDNTINEFVLPKEYGIVSTKFIYHKEIAQTLAFRNFIQYFLGK